MEDMIPKSIKLSSLPFGITVESFFISSPVYLTFCPDLIFSGNLINPFNCLVISFIMTASAFFGITAPVITFMVSPLFNLFKYGLPAYETPTSFKQKSFLEERLFVFIAYPSIAEFLKVGILILEITFSEEILPREFFRLTFSCI